jgi:hypothetical protein
MRIGILTIHAAYNYGAMLQAYATQTALIQLGHKVQIIDYYPKEVEESNLMEKMPKNLKQLVKYLYARFNPNIQLKIRRFSSFRNRMQLTPRYYDKKELYLNPPDFDIYLVGSDQVWNMERAFNPFWFLDFVNAKKKVSYASSFGTSSIPPQYQNELKNQLNKFSAISTREADGVKIIKEATGLNATQVLDPTFLLSTDDWSSLAAKRQFAGEYILTYGFSKSKQFGELIKSVKERYKLPVVAIAIGSHYPYPVDKSFINTGPQEFVALFRDAKVVCTDSFHGLAFSIHFRKTFFSIPHLTRNSRLSSLLGLLDLKNRQFSNPMEILNLSNDELHIDYFKIEHKIRENIEISITFLTQNLG